MPGINQYPNQLTSREVREVATKSGVDLRNLSAALKGKKSMSLDMAKKTCGLFGAEEHPVSFYVMANTRTMKERVTAGDGVAAAVRGMTAVLETIQNLEPDEISKEGKALEEAVEAMVVEVNQILAHGTWASGETMDTQPSRLPGTDASGFNVTKSRRDADGRRIHEGEPVVRDPHGRAIREN